MICKAETHKKLEACIGVVNGCFNMLRKHETRDNVLGDSLMLWNTLMIQCVNLNI